jgi:hypothetical protein
MIQISETGNQTGGAKHVNFVPLVLRFGKIVEQHVPQLLSGLGGIRSALET